jgi:hypothetical protein
MQKDNLFHRVNQTERLRNIANQRYGLSARGFTGANHGGAQNVCSQTHTSKAPEFAARWLCEAKITTNTTIFKTDGHAPMAGSRRDSAFKQ